MILKGQVINTAGCFAVYPKGLSSNNANVAFSVTNEGNVRLGSAVTINNDLDIVSKKYVDNNYIRKTGSSLEKMEGSLHMIGGPEATGSNLYLTNNGFVRWGFNDINTQGEYGGYVYMRDDTTFEIGTYSNVDLKFNATNPEFVNSPSVPTPTDANHAANKSYVDDAIDAIPEPQVPATAIAGKRFRWTNTSTPLVGNLSYFAIGDTTSGVAMRVHFNSQDGRWAIAKDATFSNLSALFGIYYLNNGVLTPIRTGIIYEMTWQNTQSYVYCKIAQHVTNGGFQTGTDYYLTIGGLF